MSKTIDERVVEMQFDNRNFEKNVKTSMSTIDKLKQSLKFTGAAKGLENVSNSVKKVDMSGLGKAVETVQMKFSSLDVIAVTALSNITNAALNAGKSIVKSLTIDPITSGFQEYETQLNAVQTILANTSHAGTDIEDVNKALDELNKYADQTIYNFTEMTRNIGTFTAAGVDLDKSVTSIKGIANLAAVSGSNAQQASTAMYQLSQALAAGKVSLMDWNSVVNAGMGGKVFQDALKRTAEHFGYNVDAMIAKYGSFRESLTEGGWLTAEVLTETLTQLSGAYSEADLIAQGYSESQAKAIFELSQTAIDAATKVKTFTQLMDTVKEAVQSGWAQSWEIIIGDFEEAKEFFTGASEMIGKFVQDSADARNSLLETALSSPWKRFSKEITAAGIDIEVFEDKSIELGKKYEKVTDKMIEDSGGFEKSLKEGWLTSDIVTQVLRDMAGGMSNVTQSTEDMTKKLEYFQDVVHDVWMGDYKNGKEQIDALTKAGYDYATVQDLVNKTVDGHKLTLEDLNVEQAANLGFTKEQIQVLNDLADQAEKTGTPINELINDLTVPSGRELLLGSFSNVLEGLLKVITTVKQAWAEVFPPNPKGLYNAIKSVNDFTKNLIMTDETADKLKRSLKGFFAILDIVSTLLGGGLKIALKVVGTLLGVADGGVLSVTASVGDMIVAFRDWLLENNFVIKGIKKLSQGLDFAVESVRNWIENIKDSKDLPKEIAKGIMNGLTTAVHYVSDVISEMVAMVTGGFSELPDNMVSGFVGGIQNGVRIIGQTMIELGKMILSKIKEVLGIHSPSTEFFEIGQNIIAGLVNGIKTLLSGLWGIISGIGSKIIEIFKSIDFGTVFAVLISTGMLVAFYKLGKVLSVILSPLESLDDLLGSASNVLDRFSGVLKSFSMEIKAKAIKTIAIAIAILAGSVVVLTMLDVGKMWNAVGVLAALAGIMVLLSVAMNKFGVVTGNINTAKLVGTILGIATALLLISGVMKILSSMSWDELGRASVGMMALGSVLISLVAVTSMIKGEINKVGPTFVKLAFALLLLVGVAKLISGMSWDDMGKAAIGLAGLGAIVSGLILVTKLAGKDIDKVGPTLFKLSAAMLILTFTAKIIAKMSWGDMGKAAAGLAGLTAIVGGLIFVTNLAGKDIDKVGSTLLKLSAAMIILSYTAKIIAGMSWGDMGKALVGLTGLSLIIGALVFITNLASEKELARLGRTLLMMSVSIGILAGISVLLGMVEIKHLAKGLAAVGLLSGMMAILVKATRGSRDVMKNPIVLTVAIGILVASVAALSLIDPKKLASATLALSAVMGVFSLLVKASSTAKAAFGPVILMTTVVGFLSGCLYLLAKLPIDSVMGSAASLSVLMLALSASLAIISAAGAFGPTALIAVGLMSLILGVLSGSLYLLSSLPVESMLATTASLTTLLLGLSAACLVLAGVGALGPAAFIGIGALATLIAGIGGLMVGIGALATYYPAMEDFLDKGIGILEKIGYGIGSFFGNIIGGFSAGATSGLPKIGENLSLFMLNLQPFLLGVKMIDDSVIDGVLALAQTILILSGASIVEGIASWLTGGSSMTRFASELVPFGIGMKAFSVAIAGMDADLVSNAAIAGKALAEMAATIPNMGGLAAFFAGENDLTAFGEKLPSFGKAMKAFSDEITGMNPDIVMGAANAGKAIAEMASTIPNSGGVIGFFAGENDMEAFGDQLVPFGKAIKEFSVAVTGLNADTVTNAATAGKAVAEMATTLPNSGGVIGFFAGENDMAAFGTQLVLFGRAIKEFSVAVTGLDVETVTNAATAGKALSELATSIPNIGGLVSFFTGSNDMVTFGTQLVSFGKSFKEYAGYMVDISPDIVNTTTSAAQSLVTLAKTLPEDKFFTNETWLDEFGSQLSTFGYHFSGYYGYISGVNVSTLSGVITETNRLVDMAKGMSSIDTSGMSSFGLALVTLGNNGIDGFISAFTGAVPRVTEAANYMLNSMLSAFQGRGYEFNSSGQNIINQFVLGIKAKESAVKGIFTTLLTVALNVIRGKQEEFNQAGQALMNKLVSGIKANESKLTKSFENPINSMLSTVNSRRSDFVNAGKNLVEGFAEGISANTYLAESKAAAMAKSSYNSAMRAMNAHSPSRLFMEAGSYVPAGFAIGIESGEKEVANSSKSMAQKALEATKTAISIISDMFDSDLDTQPTIRPVLDLSNVQEGAGYLNTLFGQRQVASISGIMSNPGSRENQNGGKETSSGDTYNFTQNNYSPKALSRIDIYRQTNNQFSAFERRVKA